MDFHNVDKLVKECWLCLQQGAKRWSKYNDEPRLFAWRFEGRQIYLAPRG